MSLLLQINLIAGSLVLFIVVLASILKNTLQIKYSIIWLFSSFVLLLLSIFPQFVLGLIAILGIKTEVNAIFLLMILFLYVITVGLTFSLSRASLRIKKIAQEIALLEYELTELKQKLEM